VAFLVACSKPSSHASYGEPVGVRVDDPAAPTGAQVQAAFAVTSGQSPDALMPGVARAVHTALVKCPAASKMLQRGEGFRFAGKLDHGRAAFGNEPTGSAEADCVRAGIAAEALTDNAALALDFAIELSSVPREQKGTP
jgi:hypothetical protein